MDRYVKVWFSAKGQGRTAGLIVKEAVVLKGIGYISSLYPASEAPKMKTFHVSPLFNSVQAAFLYDPETVPA